jgi:type VI secretion system protein ImpH
LGHTALGFVPSDILRIQAGLPSGEAYGLVTAAMSLAGNSGPLPSPFAEMILARNSQKDFATRDFLDIFHHRLLRLFYLIRKRSRPSLCWSVPGQPAIGRLTSHLANLPTARVEGRPVAWGRHAALLGGIPRSVQGLTQFLNDRLGLPFRIRSLTGGWRPLPADYHCALSRYAPARSTEGQKPRAIDTALPPMKLGQTAVLGRHYWTPEAGLELLLPDLPYALLESLLPGQPNAELLSSCLSHYLARPVQACLKLRPQTQSLPASRLSQGMRLRLGQTTWLWTGQEPKAKPSPLQLMLGLG